MSSIFISYSTKDHIFAELAFIKLTEAGVTVWRDQGSLKAGGDWRNGIERGIASSSAVLLALSRHSVESPYVTFEWAYALGKRKIVIPVKLEQCNVHPRLEPIQHLDFSIPGALPWDLLIDQIKEIEAEATPEEDPQTGLAAEKTLSIQDSTVTAILAYLDHRGYQMMSYDKVREKINPELTDRVLDELVDQNPQTLRRAILKGQRTGLAKRIP